jgi:hypothetical protein
MSDNMSLWKRVCTTATSAVKKITGKQYQGHSPKPYWLIERATQEFGPVGIGWGVTVKSERFERLTDTDVLHVAIVSVWYVLDGKRSETFEQMGGTKACYKTSSGSMMIDEDAGKKSVTDGMVKCLSMIGFAGDIFSGRWDDSKYVSELKAEESGSAGPTVSELPNTENNYPPDGLDFKKLLGAANSIPDLVKVMNGLDAIDRAAAQPLFNQRKQELAQQKA